MLHHSEFVCPVDVDENTEPCWLRGTDSNVNIKSCRSVKSTEVLKRTATPALSRDRWFSITYVYKHYETETGRIKQATSHNKSTLQVIRV